MHLRQRGGLNTRTIKDAYRKRFEFFGGEFNIILIIRGIWLI